MRTFFCIKISALFVKSNNKDLEQTLFGTDFLWNSRLISGHLQVSNEDRHGTDFLRNFREISGHLQVLRHGTDFLRNFREFSEHFQLFKENEQMVD